MAAGLSLALHATLLAALLTRLAPHLPPAKHKDATSTLVIMTAGTAAAPPLPAAPPAPQWRERAPDPPPLPTLTPVEMDAPLIPITGPALRALFAAPKAAPPPAAPTPTPTPAPDGALTQSQTQAALAYAQAIRVRLENHRPDGTAMSGTVLLSVTVDTEGWVVATRVLQSSGNAMLDRLAIAAVREAAPLPHPPEILLRGNTAVTFTVPYRFH